MVHDAFTTPGRIVTQVSSMPDGRSYFWLARTTDEPMQGYLGTRSAFAIGLGCDLSHADRLVYSTGVDLHDPRRMVPIGSGCKVCDRPACPQRAFPSWAGPSSSTTTSPSRRPTGPHRPLAQKPADRAQIPADRARSWARSATRPRRRRAVPAVGQLVRQVEQIQGTGNRLGHHVVDARRTVVERRDRRHDDRATAVGACHQVDMSRMQGGFAEQQDDPAPLARADVGGPDDQALVVGVGNTAERLYRAGATSMPAVTWDPDDSDAPMSLGLCA